MSTNFNPQFWTTSTAIDVKKTFKDVLCDNLHIFTESTFENVDFTNLQNIKVKDTELTIQCNEKSISIGSPTHSIQAIFSFNQTAINGVHTNGVYIHSLSVNIPETNLDLENLDIFFKQLSSIKSIIQSFLIVIATLFDCTFYSTKVQNNLWFYKP